MSLAKSLDLNITVEAFKAAVGKGCAAVLFYLDSTSCPESRGANKSFQAISQEVQGVGFFTADCFSKDAFGEVMKLFDVPQRAPVVLFFRDGKVVTKTGFKSRAALKAWIEEQIINNQ